MIINRLLYQTDAPLSILIFYLDLTQIAHPLFADGLQDYFSNPFMILPRYQRLVNALWEPSGCTTK